MSCKEAGPKMEGKKRFPEDELEGLFKEFRWPTVPAKRRTSCQMGTRRWQHGRLDTHSGLAGLMSTIICQMSFHRCVQVEMAVMRSIWQQSEKSRLYSRSIASSVVMRFPRYLPKGLFCEPFCLWICWWCCWFWFLWLVALTWCDAESNDHPERVRPGKDCYTQSDLAFFVAHRMGSSFLIYVCGALGSIKKSCFAGGLTHVGVRHISTETRNVSIVQSRFFFTFHSAVLQRSLCALSRVWKNMEFFVYLRSSWLDILYCLSCFPVHSSCLVTQCFLSKHRIFFG